MGYDAFGLLQGATEFMVAVVALEPAVPVITVTQETQVVYFHDLF
jgi:hypothetical protein